MTNEDQALIETMFIESEQRLSKWESNSKKRDENLNKRIDKHDQLMEQNSRDIQKNTERIEQNSRDIQKNTERIEQNSRDIQKNTERIEQNSRDIQKNNVLLEKNMKMTESNTLELRRIGVLMEQLHDAMQMVIENNVANWKLIKQTEKRLDDNEIEKLPILWEKNQSFGKRLKKVEASIN